jgi:ribosomal protein L37E/multisubunit Na+/H+ antiporter MnhC subunit
MSFRRRASARPMAWRMTLTAVGIALGVVAVATAAVHAVLRDSFASGLTDFVIFGGLSAATAGVLAWELASNRRCPRCGQENGRQRSCAECGYDLQERPRYACTEGHQVLFEPGLCDCGRRAVPLRPVPVFGHALTSIVIGVALVAALAVAALLASLVN